MEGQEEEGEGQEEEVEGQGEGVEGVEVAPSYPVPDGEAVMMLSLQSACVC